MLSFGDFMVLCLYLIYFELILQMMMKGAQFLLFCACGYTVFPMPYIEETILSALCILDAFVKTLLNMNEWVYFLTFYSDSLTYVFVFMPIACCFDYYPFVI